MHLDLVDGPFVSHNLISAQESPAPLPNFQTAPRLKILMSSGSKKGTQIYYPFLSKSPGKQIPSRIPNGAPMERDARLQGIFTYLFICISLSERPEEESVPPYSPKAGPLWRETPIPVPYLTYFLGSPARETSLQVPSQSSQIERHPTFRAPR